MAQETTAEYGPLEEIWPVTEELIKSTYKISYGNTIVNTTEKSKKISGIFLNKIKKQNKIDSERYKREWNSKNIEGLYEIFLRLKEKSIEYGLKFKSGNTWDDFLNELIELCYLNSLDRTVKVDISKIENSKEFMEEFTLEFEDLFNEVLKWGINKNNPVYLDFPINLVRNLMVTFIDIGYLMRDDESTVSVVESDNEIE
jgi:hypothetical protein